MAKQHAQLVTLLIDHTENGKINWTEGANEKAFQTNIGSNTIVVSPKGSDVAVRVYNESGKLVDEFADPDLATYPLPRGISSWYQLMLGLLEAARRNALGADKILGDIIDDLRRSQ